MILFGSWLTVTPRIFFSAGTEKKGHTPTATHLIHFHYHIPTEVSRFSKNPIGPPNGTDLLGIAQIVTDAPAECGDYLTLQDAGMIPLTLKALTA
jgi:hypothetical protein